MCVLYGCFCKKWINRGKYSRFIHAIHLFQLTVAIEQFMNCHVDKLVIFVCVLHHPNPHPLIQHSGRLGVNHTASHHRDFRACAHVPDMSAWRGLRDRHVVALRYVWIRGVCMVHHSVIWRGTRRSGTILNVLLVAVITLKRTKQVGVWLQGAFQRIK